MIREIDEFLKQIEEIVGDMGLEKINKIEQILFECYEKGSYDYELNNIKLE